MAGLIQKYKLAVPSKIKRLCSKIKPDRMKSDVERNDEFNYKLIKYIWWKNFHIEIKNAQLEKNHSSVKPNYDVYLEQSCWIQTTKFEELLKKIATQPKKKYIHKSLKTLNIFGMLYYEYQYLLDNAQQNSIDNCIKQSLNIILSQGKLEKTKIITQKQCKELIEKNKEILNELEKHSGDRQQKISLETRRIILGEIIGYIRILKNKKFDQEIQQLQQELNEVTSIMRSNIEGVITRRQSLEVLLEKTENLKEAAEEFFSNTKRTKHKYKTASNKIFYYALAVVAAIIVTVLICYCIYTTFSKPIQSLDNVELMQNMGKLINSIT